jgi:hypothetical protein
MPGFFDDKQSTKRLMSSLEGKISIGLKFNSETTLASSLLE